MSWQKCCFVGVVSLNLLFNPLKGTTISTGSTLQEIPLRAFTTVVASIHNHRQGYAELVSSSLFYLVGTVWVMRVFLKPLVSKYYNIRTYRLLGSVLIARRVNPCNLFIAVWCFSLFKTLWQYLAWRFPSWTKTVSRFHKHVRVVRTTHVVRPPSSHWDILRRVLSRLSCQ